LQSCLEKELRKPIQTKNAHAVLSTIKARTSHVYPGTTELQMPAKSSLIAHVETNGKHYHGKGLSKSLPRQDVAEKVLKDIFFEKMAVKSTTCTCGQPDTQAANSSVDKNKEKIDAQNVIVT
ncbi:PREDICTED: uncharacterized protein LOC108762709, partial [Trachymyrmex cornetzi]|uniref:uncharacterized protein LOC108762709 n=1 Tax=Trachymyrmex cornetzi TaxID=471704 RepID=UPI00084F5292